MRVERPSGRSAQDDKAEGRSFSSHVTILTGAFTSDCYNPCMSSALERVQQHLRLYEHPLVQFNARETGDNIEVAISPRFTEPAVHTYVFEVHPRDLDDPRFEWMLQRHIFDGLQDYMIEMFIRTPQHFKENQQREREGKL
jgi:hypothetical protein